jgi:hypothetical protein
MLSTSYNPTNYELHLLLKKINYYEPSLLDIINIIALYYYHKLPLYKIIKLHKHQITIIDLNNFIIQIKNDLFNGLFISDKRKVIESINNVSDLSTTYSYLNKNFRFEFVSDLLTYYNGEMTNLSFNILIYVFDLNNDYNLDYLMSSTNYNIHQLLL